MFSYWEKLFEAAGFIPQGQGFLWNREVLIFNLIGDGLTVMAFIAIPAALLYFRKKRQDLAHNYVFVLFAFFIFISASTHLIEMVTIWLPVYRLQSLFKLVTGLVSVGTAIVIIRTLPQLLSVPSNSRLGEINKKLEQEVAEREKAQVALREANATLESRVQQRTSQLIGKNRELENEISQRKMTEQELLEKNQELHRINADLDDFVYCASANLKAPIINMEGLVVALKEEIPQRSAHVNEILHRLDGSLLKADRTVLDLTEVSRLQKFGLETELAELPLSEILEVVKTDLADLITATQAEIRADFSAAPSLKLAFNDLKRILFNLIFNCIKNQQPGTAPVISILSEARPDGIALQIIDNGFSLAFNLSTRDLFAPDRRFSGNGASTGVGLYIIKRIIDNYGGQIQVHSNAAGGRAFELVFPNVTNLT